MRHLTWIRKCLIATVLAASLTIGAGAVSFGSGVVNATALNLRSEPTTASASLGLVENGTIVEVLEDAVGGWYKVVHNGTTGYMSADYLVVTANAEGETVADETGLTDLGNGKVTLKSGYLNIRAEASTLGAKLGAIPNGAVVALSEYVEGWYLVTYGEITGYVSGDYITVTNESVSAMKEGVSGADIVAKAKLYLGCPYVYGSAGPKSFDCSGFTSFIYKQFGFSINRTASTQLNNNGVSVDRANLQPGDLVFFRDYSCSKSASHVGIYIGDGQFIHASSSRSKTGVKISALSEEWYANRYVGAKRILA